tara:strand:+ start:283 stop:612 length:330 start_codon:yes stop_codon:yes gene_type:complete
MSSIQKVFDCVDIRRKIFNLKSQNIKTTTQNNYDLVIEELNECFNNILTYSTDFDGEPIYDYVEFDWIMRQDKYFTAFFWLIDEIRSQKLQKQNLKNIEKLNNIKKLNN